MSVHTNTFDCYAFHIQINVTVVLLPFTLLMLAFHAFQCWATTSHVGQPDCDTSNQIWQALGVTGMR